MQHDELPALLGGTAVRPQGPPPWPGPDPDVLAALEAAYRDGSWGKYHGPACERLQAALRAYHDIEHVLLCGSGTFAVELALRALNVGRGAEVLLAGYDYPGNFLGVHAVGAHPVLVDVDPGNWNLALDLIASGISKNTRALIVSHLHGGIVPMREVIELAEDCDLSVVEDAAQCPGALIQGRMAGAWGHAGILSFGGSKLLSAGRGGALLTASSVVHQRARTHQLRGNLICPLSELQAAVLIPQLAKLEARNEERLRRVDELSRALEGLPGIRLFRNGALVDCRPAYYKVGLQFDATAFGLDRAVFLKACRGEGMAVDEGFAGLHMGRSPRRFRAAGGLSETERAHHGAVVLHHPLLLEGAQGVREFAQALGKIHEAREALANTPALQ